MSLKDTYTSAWEVFPVEIEAGASLTSTINLGGLRLFGIVMPSEWPSENLTFQISPDAGATWVNMLDQNGNEILATATPSSFIALNTPYQFAAIQYLKIRSGTSSIPVVQTTGCALQLLLRSI